MENLKRERGAIKAFSNELFNSIIEASKEDGKCSEKKKIKNFKAEKIETKLVVKVETFLWKTL